MKQNNTILTVAAVAIGVLLLRKRQQATAGVGAINPYIAVSELQKRGIDFKKSWEAMSEREQDIITTYAKTHGYKPSGKQIQAGKYLYGELFLRKIRGTYTKAVGAVDLLSDAIEYPILDENGRTAAVYRDRSSFPVLQELKQRIEERADSGSINTPEEGYWATVLYISNGNRFLWDDKKGGGLRNELFATRGNAAEERKQRISYLGSKEKGGIGIQVLAERWTSNGGDFLACRDGIIQALLNVTSVKQAQQQLETAALKELDDLIEQRNSGYDPSLPF